MFSGREVDWKYLCRYHMLTVHIHWQKGPRSYFSLRRMINFRLIRKSFLFKLFDALKRPVVSYACQLWLPSTGLSKLFNNSTQGMDEAKKIAANPLENLHLSLLKWTMGVHKSTSNSAMWGDTDCGRYPLGIELSKMVVSYHERLEGMDRDNSSCLVRRAFCEQKVSILAGILQWRLSDIR